jgi:adenine-specific DNA-methyltransferase
MTQANPLFGRKTELIWDGKYDDTGRRVAPLRVALPFQTVETVNETVQERQKSLLLFESPGRFGGGEWRNRLIWGDKKYVLPSLMAEFAGKVNLIYIDPPFLTGADFSFAAKVPDHPDSDENDSFAFTKEPSIIEQKAYRDTWGRGLDSYVQWFYETAVLLHELLHETGSIYVHIGSRLSHPVRLIMEEIFGYENIRAQIMWNRTSAHANVINNYGQIHDTIFFGTKSERWTWNQQYAPYTKEYLELFFDQVAENGRRYARRDLTASMVRASSGQIYTWKGITPTGSRCWAMTKDRMDELDAQGRIHWPKKQRWDAQIEILCRRSSRNSVAGYLGRRRCNAQPFRRTTELSHAKTRSTA